MKTVVKTITQYHCEHCRFSSIHPDVVKEHEAKHNCKHEDWRYGPPNYESRICVVTRTCKNCDRKENRTMYAATWEQLWQWSGPTE